MQSLSKIDILNLSRVHQVRFVRLQFTDLHGTLKNVEVPITQLEQALDGKVMFDGSSIQGFVRIEESDMYLKPDFNTWQVLPWTSDDATVARLICNVCLPDGLAFAGDPRGILQRVTEEATSLGFPTQKFGVELEFFLLKLDGRARPTADPSDRNGYFDMAPLDAGEVCRREIAITLQNMGYEVVSTHHETAPGQHEIVFPYNNAVTAADTLMTAKVVIRTICVKHGLYATFMPKPLQDTDGSGMHCHQVLFSNKGNAFFDRNHEFGLSDVARAYIAGLLRHASAITAITNPTVNSYKRLVPGHEAPAYAFWSTKHRMPFVRVRTPGDEATIELRSPDSSCNPYLAFAAMLRAGLDGIRRHMVPPKPFQRNLAYLSEEELFQGGVVALPSNLEQAIEALEEDEVICGALGEHAFQYYIHAKLTEWEMYRKTVHVWEWEQYLHT